ncbi:MAG TPA: SIS domain-containing protein [Bryobacteraceae bacterium]|nr:SIS domain-containing protein [Bryobacteraceae bacterium]
MPSSRDNGLKMRYEIRQQPEALRRTIEAGMATAFELRRRFEKQRPRMVVLAARGTSDNAAQFGRYLIEITTGIPVSLAAPSTLTLYGSRVDYRDALVVGISQSGESTDINALMTDARDGGAMTLGISNETESSLMKTVDCALRVCAGKEQSVAATKTYTGQLAALYLLGYALGAPIDFDELRRLPARVESTLKLEDQIADAAAQYRSMTRAMSIGRGLNYCTALEFGLKLMETCYVSAERFSSADLLHGPIAVVEDAFPAFVFAPQGVTWPSVRDLIERLGGLGAETLVFSDLPAAETRGLPANVISLPPNDRDTQPEDLCSPIPLIVPAQLFCAHLAASKELNPDAPRGLSKVTLTM